MRSLEDRIRRSIQKKVGNAIGKFNLIEAGDVIGIGLSGGKDSVTLLKMLSALQIHSPVPFTLKAITINMGWGVEESFLVDLCKHHGVEFYLENTQIGEIVFEHKNVKSPCSLCANMRRGAVNNAAKKLGCNKVALGHHLDDMLETLLLGMFYEGRFHTFSPRVYLSRIDLTVIRPLIFVEESEIVQLAELLQYPKARYDCPLNGFTKRQRMKELIQELSLEIPDIRRKLLSSVQNMSLDSAWSDM